MSFHQYLEFKALERKFASDNEVMLEMVLKTDEAKAQMKNVCALIHVELFNELNAVCDLLEISKRKFIEGAIIEAIQLASKVVEQVGLHEHYQHLAEQHHEQVSA